MNARTLGSLLLALALLHVALIQPNHPLALRASILLFFPLELPAVIAALLLMPDRHPLTHAFRGLLVLALIVIALLKIGDFGTFTAYGRPFTVSVDHHLMPAGWMLLSGSVGTLLAALLFAGALCAVVAAAVALWWATGRIAAQRIGHRFRLPLAALGILSLGIAVADIGYAAGQWRLSIAPPGSTAFTARVGVEHATRNGMAVRELARFREMAEHDPLAGAAGLFDALGDRDLILVYVESYGRSSFDNPLYAATHPATLREIEERLDAAGLAMRSGWLASPVVGGQSWLAHATVASGLWVDHQGRYQALLASPRRTLLHLAQASGRRTVAIKPAHVFAWPDGDFFGFDAIYNAADLGYAGRPFNWATMPDQFTLAAFDRLERLATDRPPLLAQIALVSSHAPFLPVPPVIAWEEIGDGRIFNQWADDGDPPEVVWRDLDRVREKFRLAVDYSLRTVGSYAERLADRSALLIVMGDHETAPFISGVEGRDVPVHVIGPPDLVALFETWGWVPGLVPDPATPTLPMDAVRDALVRTLAGPAA